MLSCHSVVWKPQRTNAASDSVQRKSSSPVDSGLELTYVQSVRKQTYAAVINHTRECTVARLSEGFFHNQSK